jgi:hypothetical protein
MPILSYFTSCSPPAYASRRSWLTLQLSVVITDGVAEEDRIETPICRYTDEDGENGLVNLNSRKYAKLANELRDSIKGLRSDSGTAEKLIIEVQEAATLQHRTVRPAPRAEAGGVLHAPGNCQGPDHEAHFGYVPRETSNTERGAGDRGVCLGD